MFFIIFSLSICKLKAAHRILYTPPVDSLVYEGFEN